MESCEYTAVANDTERNEKKKRLVQRKPFLRQLLVCSGGFTSMFVYGICIGAPTVYIPQIRKEANATNVTITDDMASWLNSTMFFCGIPLVIAVSVIAYFIGKRITLIISGVHIFAAFMLLYFSSNVTHILISQVIQSFYSATQLVIMPMIFSEYTTPRYRGTFLLINAATLYWGIWVSNAIGTFLNWKIIPLFGMICVLYMISTIFFWPESPYWLATKGKFEECATAHRWLKGCDEESERELQILINAQTDAYSTDTPYYSKKDQIKNVWKTIKSKEFYKPTLISFAIVSITNVCGKGLCIVYALDIIKKITNSESTAYIGMLILDGVTVFSMYAGSTLTRFLRRRTIVLVSSSMVAMLLFVLSLYIYLIKLEILFENKYVSIMLLSVFSVAAGCGPLIMGYAFFGEVVPSKLRALSFCLTCLSCKLSVAVLIKIAPFLFRSLGIHGFFLLFGIALSLVVLILYKYLPETKNKTMQEIADSVAGIKTTTNEKTSELLVSKNS